MPTELSPVSEPHLSGLIGLGDAGNRACRHNGHNGGQHCGHDGDGQPTAGELAYASAELRDLRAEVDRLRAERDRLNDTQRRIMELLGVTSPDRLVHDLRNVLNERELFKALADIGE